MVDIDEIVRSLASHRPKLLDDRARRHAAVAMILRAGRGGDVPEVLFIERARHADDPWSGHMAFPGGRVEAHDPHVRAAAERETREEVGLDLARAHHVGRLDDLPGRGAAKEHGLVISGHVYVWEGDAPIEVETREVQQAFWFPLAKPPEPERHVPHTYSCAAMQFPRTLFCRPGRHVVWGLTYRFIETFFGIVGRPLPPRWDFDRDALMAADERAADR